MPKIPTKKRWWPQQVYCGEEMVKDLEAFRDLVAVRIGTRLSMSSLIYNIVNDHLPVLVKKAIDGEEIWKDWQKAPGMEFRPRKGPKPKAHGRWKGKRRKIHTMNASPRVNVEPVAS